MGLVRNGGRRKNGSEYLRHIIAVFDGISEKRFLKESG
jgi:hypothetical protein